MYTYIIVDDESLIRKGTIKKLSPMSDLVQCIGEADEGQAGIRLIEAQKPDFVILDMQMPGMDGTQLLGYLSEHYPDMPLIVISGFRDFDYIKTAISADAIDYILKPFRNRELISRIENVLRRTGKTKKRITVGEVEVDAESDLVLVKGEPVEFTQLEYKILLMLVQNAGQTLTREQILERIWDMAGNFVEDNTLTVYIKRIREKLGSADVIRTVKGVGYRVEAPEDSKA